MPITVARPPADVVATLEQTLPRFAASTSVEARVPAVSQAATRFTGRTRHAQSIDEVAAGDPLAMPVYVLGLDDLVAGRVGEGARLALWATLLPSETGAVSAEVQAGTARFAQISDGAAARDLRLRVLDLPQDSRLGDTERELAQLRIPALHLTCIWLQTSTGEDVFVPTGDVPAPLEPGRHYTGAELADDLRAPAQARLDNDLEG